MRMIIFPLSVILLLFASACGPPEPKTYPEGSIAAALAADGRFTTFLEITDEVIHEASPPLLVNPERALTIFAPIDEAFASLAPELVKQLKQDPAMAEELLFHYGFDKLIFSKDFELLKTRPTIITPVHVTIENDEDQIKSDGALVIEKDIQVGNSVLHIVDSVTSLNLLTD